MVWGADELRRGLVRRRTTALPSPPAPALPVAEVPAHHLPTVLPARHSWNTSRLVHALGVSEHAAAEVAAHARRIAAEHGRRAP